MFSRLLLASQRSYTLRHDQILFSLIFLAKLINLFSQSSLTGLKIVLSSDCNLPDR
jgi:hypothetical protein